MRTSVALGVLIIIALALLIVAREYGNAQPPPLPSLYPGDCPSPCWQGIRPGISSRGQLADVMVNNAPLAVHAPGDGNPIGRFVLDVEAAGIRVGDLIRIWGLPSHVWVSAAAFSDNKIGCSASFYFADGLIIATTVVIPDMYRLRPDAPIRQIGYHTPSKFGPPIRIGTPPWTGFDLTRAACVLAP